ncbi:ATP-binding protein [Timonella senegalensis]|uniref:ATP-binding protein n=1 Tax=Timonella senegalensis TaxID=1465825 RepID=UPI0028A5BDA6|nr:hypothetical protein [Timonella senegalensis]
MWRNLVAHLTEVSRDHVLFIGDPSGSGKSTTALTLHELLVDRDAQHAAIEGDYLDLARPEP